ncbi:hypothetical protein [Cognatishimia sp. F0-27]|uniref:hypothetical protein n=1 Tax=Cognatishimia sp. F0-27 TaxID=2816855 RepID=UPI001D0C465B|nr:hypothetical protein [Cognatishimia sp. F0-27]MCC1491456.1 hypothetical protein [Cognatishimia sp. F0-27]
MSSKKKTKKDNPKDSQLIIRINASDRDRFVSLCKSLETSAAKEIRSFILGFINDHQTKSKKTATLKKTEK